MANKDSIRLNQAGTLTRGINENQPDFQSELMYTDATVNVTSGIVEGIGPRYGFAPIPGQMDQEAPASQQLPGLMRAELGYNKTSGSTWTRVGVMGIIPLRLGGPNSSIQTKSTYYAVIISYTTTEAAGTYFDVVLLSTLDGSGNVQQGPNIYDGLAYVGPDLVFNPSAAFVGSTWGASVEMIPGNATQKAANILSLLSLPATTRYVSSTPFQTSGADIPMNWVVGTATGTASSATIAPSVQFGLMSFLSGYIGTGTPSNFNVGNVKNSQRSVQVYGLDAAGANNIDYAVIYSPSGIYKPLYLETNSGIQIDYSGLTAEQTNSGTTYSNTKYALVNDNQLTTNCAQTGVLVANTTNPTCVIFQDWYRNYLGAMNQYVDLVNMPLKPINASTIIYTEDTQPTPCCFTIWPPFVSGTPMAGEDYAQLGAAGTGLLRANTVYEFTYSVYNKRLNCESNVGSPVKIQTGSDDFVSLILFDQTDNMAAYFIVHGINIIQFPGVAIVSHVGTVPTNIYDINYLEYRFYYRQAGMQDWLPALQIDASKWWFYPYNNPLTILYTGSAIGGDTGGDVGGFNDYSTLPADNYTCVTMYKNRAFWLSANSLVFSNLNNVYAYAQRNSAACPVGSFKGALVQAYYGQANQNARLVIFSTDGTYVGQFTGVLEQVPVTVSAQTGPINFGLDGSDFVINAWTSVTAFSYRSAVVAEGLLYFWGPQGIFLDDGVNAIQRISVPLEPQIFNLYDASQTDAIHCEYNDTTKEVWWFYSPQTADATYPTHGICYNKLKNSWLYGQFRGQIDAVSSLHVDNVQATAGTRLVAYSRASASSSIQRAYYFDQNNLAADIFPGQELMVKEVIYNTDTQVQLLLAAGHSTGTVSPGDLIATQQCAAYTSGAITAPNDFIAQVASVSTGNIVINLPVGGSLGGLTTIITNHYQYFPIWHAAGTKGAITGLGINAFPYVLDTKFWVPNGMNYWGYWFYIHLVYKLYDLLPVTVPLTHIFAYQSPVSGMAGSDILTLINNSANNCQIYHPLVPGQMSMEGQGIKMTFSGIQLASSWVLQFLESMSEYKDGNQLKIFNG